VKEPSASVKEESVKAPSYNSAEIRAIMAEPGGPKPKPPPRESDAESRAKEALSRTSQKDK
jgi:hypothetical protein